ncbi:MAG TPA: serine/threonine-protein kinase [Pyrinomonadaceae bacterium]|nr:serine/threonine-protein kinase [Pyrinomonadaceae bacterium]
MTELKLQQSLLDGRYEILDCLGRGSYAEIYVARDLAAAEGMPQTVVIKALNVLLQGVPDADLERTLIENFQNEAVALDRVRHPHIISRLGHGTALDLGGTAFHYIVLEYMAGGELGARVRQHPFSLERALFYLEQVCSGLQHAHDCGVIHRDIKPQNLLLTADAQNVKIADFGVAKIEASEGAITRVGTNVYAAPEHNPLVQTGPLDTASLPSQPHLTPAADIYSLAKTTYTLLAGEAPRRFSHRQITELPESVARKTWAPDVLRVLRRATEDRPERRHQTVREFWEELSDANLPPTQPLRPQDGEGERERPVSKQLKTDDVVGEAPPRPRFDSRDSIKQSQMRGNGAARPRIVVPVAGGQARVSTMLPPAVVARHPARPTAAPPPARTRHADNPNDFTPAEEEEARRRWLRALVALLIIVAFAGVLLATHYYVSRRRAQQQQTGTTVGNTTSPEVGREGVVRTPANLRRDPDRASNPPLRVVQRGARVRILSVNDNNNWYEVEVLTEEGTAQDAIKRGWMGRSTVDLD